MKSISPIIAINQEEQSCAYQHCYNLYFYMQGLRFDGKAVLRHMATRCDMTENNSKVFDEYKIDGL